MCLLLAATGLLFAFSLGSANAACQPGTSHITYFTDNTLQWTATNPNNCTISSYVLLVLDEEDATRYQFQASSTTLNYTFPSFLETCKRYSFEVHALTTEYVLGPSSIYNTTIFPTKDVNLSLSALNVTTNASTHEVNLTWDMQDKETLRCIAYYRVVYWNGNNTPNDNYVYSPKFSLKDDIPCKNYNVQVNAIITDPIINGPVSETVMQIPERAPANPNVVSIVTTTSSVNMVWKLQPLVENYCSLTALNIYTLGVAGDISFVQVPIVDGGPRADVNFTLAGLEHAHVYTSLVNVQNNAGTSGNVTVVYQTAN